MDTPALSLKNTTKQAVDDLLTERFITRVNAAGTIHERYARLWHVTQSLVCNGGKRYRPYLTMIGNGGFSERVVPIAAAQELIHYAMLMHDDIIDQDSLRRGVKNAIGLYEDEYQPYLSPELSRHYAYGAGLVAGDALISEAYRLIIESLFDDATKIKLGARLHQSIYEVVGGELMDVEAGFMVDRDFDPLRIYRYKTAGYSFAGPLLSGALCAGLSEQTFATLEKIGIALGIAYQLQDDILGLISTEEELGKSVLIDIREAKATLIVQLHKNSMNSEQSDRFVQTFGNVAASRESLEAIRQDMIATGSIKGAQDKVAEYLNEAALLVDTLESAAQRTALHELIGELSGRKN